MWGIVGIILMSRTKTFADLQHSSQIRELCGPPPPCSFNMYSMLSPLLHSLLPEWGFSNEWNDKMNVTVWKTFLLAYILTASIFYVEFFSLGEFFVIGLIEFFVLLLVFSCLLLFTEPLPGISDMKKTPKCIWNTWHQNFKSTLSFFVRNLMSWLVHDTCTCHSKYMATPSKVMVK